MTPRIIALNRAAELLAQRARRGEERILSRRQGREQRRRRWGAPRDMLLAGATLVALQAQRNKVRFASGVTTNRMSRTRQGGWRVRNGPRRACVGRAVKRHFGGGAVCWSWPVPQLAALRGGT